MKKAGIVLMLFGIMILYSCRNQAVKEYTSAAAGKEEPGSGLVAVATDIITEVIVKPDTLGDPWELEKVKGYNGKLMFASLFDNIYNKKIVVYDIMSDAPLDPTDVRKMEKDFNSDITRIAKFQFLEDWYFNSETNKIIKKIKSISFGYEIMDNGFPKRYKALFKLKTE
jgi:hypothetical protein